MEGSRRRRHYRRDKRLWEAIQAYKGSHLEGGIHRQVDRGKLRHGQSRACHNSRSSGTAVSGRLAIGGAFRINVTQLRRPLPCGAPRHEARDSSGQTRSIGVSATCGSRVACVGRTATGKSPRCHELSTQRQLGGRPPPLEWQQRPTSTGSPDCRGSNDSADCYSSAVILRAATAADTEAV
eukprot:GHVT01020152.1.p1 GENE.GHVT01020152.1~~GHVT01020152.1.p1  ORF type:complete len:181 (-),score=27.82 GHVT01020152.1:722-1264(-)